MKYKSRAIPIHYIKHGESSIIAKIFTEEMGLISFIVKGIRNKKSKKKLVLFQPLQLVMVEGKYVAKKNLQVITDINLYSYKKDSKIYIEKTFLWIFISEILSKVLKENQIDKNLFSFIWNLKIGASQNNTLIFNPDLLFLIDLTKHLGFYPLKNLSEGMYFDLELGQFTKKIPRKNYINKENTCYFKKLINNADTPIPLKNRKALLLNIFQYYALQHHELKNIASHKILQHIS